MSHGISFSFVPTLYVALGGAIGAAARFQVGHLANRMAGPEMQFPWATLTVNLMGSLIMGALMGWFTRDGVEGENLRLFLMTGLIGGFTTFSAFSAEMVTMIYRGQYLLASLYAGGSIILGVFLFLVGLVAIQSAQ
ncbi:MAG: fluoride efflux transporter CrcB [Pseudomonadota bacterium]